MATLEGESKQRLAPMAFNPSAPDEKLAKSGGGSAKPPPYTGLDDEIEMSTIVPAPDPKELLSHATSDNMPPGLTRVPDGQDLWGALDRAGYLYSEDAGTSCMGRIIDNDHMGIIERKGVAKFVKPGQWMLWDPWTSWSTPHEALSSSPVIKAKGLTIVALNQRQVIAVRDKDGKSLLLKSGRYILEAPSCLLGNIVSLVTLPPYLQVDRFNFFNVPQGEVAGITMPSGTVKILQPGVHIIEDCKFERFLPTVPIQSKLKKEVITSDLVTVSLEVDIATQLVDCARFLKMSAGSGGAGRAGCKDLYDAIEESAMSHFVDAFAKTVYYNLRTRQGEEESRFEENALNYLDREARKYGGRVLKVNILKQRADSVEEAYAAHNKQQVELEHKKQAQARTFDIADAEQKHKQQMDERAEMGTTQKQGLMQEREIAAKKHQLKIQLEDARAKQEKMDLEAKAVADREKMQASAEADAQRVRGQGEADARAALILTIAEAEAKAADLQAHARALAAKKLLEAVGNNRDLLEMERTRMIEEYKVRQMEAMVKAGAKVVPVEMLRMFDLADERLVRRLENQAVMQVMTQGPMSSVTPYSINGHLPGSVNHDDVTVYTNGKKDSSSGEKKRQMVIV